jgi:hypothetical protein
MLNEINYSLQRGWRPIPQLLRNPRPRGLVRIDGDEQDLTVTQTVAIRAVESNITAGGNVEIGESFYIDYIEMRSKFAR